MILSRKPTIEAADLHPYLQPSPTVDERTIRVGTPLMAIKHAGGV